MSDDNLSSSGGFRGAVRRRPVLSLIITAAIFLVIGAAVGMTDTVPKSDLNKADRELETKNAQLSALRGELTAAQTAREEAVSSARTAQQEAERITARGKVPSFKGQAIEDVERNGVVDDFEWQIATRRQVSTAEPGTILSQRPASGRSLGRGATLRVVVAKKAPPKPKQWVSILSLSGSGAKRTSEFQIPDGEKVRVKYVFSGDVNDTLQLKRPDEGDDSLGDLIVNEIGGYSGTSRLYGKAGTYYLDIDGGSWTIDVQVFKRP